MLWVCGITLPQYFITSRANVCTFLFSNNPKSQRASLLLFLLLLSRAKTNTLVRSSRTRTSRKNPLPLRSYLKHRRAAVDRSRRPVAFSSKIIVDHRRNRPSRGKKSPSSTSRRISVRRVSATNSSSSSSAERDGNP